MRRFAFASALAAAPIALADTPVVVMHQGFLLDANDAPANATALPLGLSVWSEAGAGTRVWPAGADSACAVDVRQGYFAVTLDGSQPSGCGAGLTAEHLSGGERWLQLTVDGITMEPRLRLAPAATATLAARSLDTEALAARLARADGTVNAGGNPVDWSQLKNVPPAFADGNDASNTYTAGAGLALASGAFSIANDGVGAAMLASDGGSLAKVSNGKLALGGSGRLESSVSLELTGTAKYLGDGSQLTGLPLHPNALAVGGNAATGTLAFGTTSAQAAQLVTNGAPRITVTSAGNVGIGKPDPAALLDVNGALAATSVTAPLATVNTIVGKVVLPFERRIDAARWLNPEFVTWDGAAQVFNASLGAMDVGANFTGAYFYATVPVLPANVVAANQRLKVTVEWWRECRTADCDPQLHLLDGADAGLQIGVHDNTSGEFLIRNYDGSDQTLLTSQGFATHLSATCLVSGGAVHSVTWRAFGSTLRTGTWTSTKTLDASKGLRVTFGRGDAGEGYRDRMVQVRVEAL